MNYLSPDAKLIPANIKEAIDAYVASGRPPGDFTGAVLDNNLCEAVARADGSSLANLIHIVAYCWWEIPGNCWGSPAKVEAWLTKHRVLRETTARTQVSSSAEARD